ncbi:DHHA1 domain protein [uncultured archaeon]|nr:DHHA1 domain protein [uncultured archaeon]
MIDLVVYHNACPDGWAAAYIAKKRWPGAELLPMNYGQDLSELFLKSAGKHIFMVDYSLRTRELNDQLNSEAKRLWILDHHKTAKAVLEGANYATFDMERSGAGLAWDYLFGIDSDALCREANARPWFVNYTEDRDLWRNKLPRSEEVNAYLISAERTTEKWDEIAKMSLDDAVHAGSAARQYIEYYVRGVGVETQAGVYVFSGRNYHTGVVNMPYVGVSDALHAVVKAGFDIGMAWFERGDGVVQFSLRSEGDTDVSEIAKSQGGGGHKHAAGYQLPLTAARAHIDWILGRTNHVTRCC